MHDIFGFIVDPNFNLDHAVLTEAADILARVGQHFGAIEAEFDPSLGGVEIDHSQIRSGLFIAYDYVLSAMTDLLGELDQSPSD